MSCQNGNCNSGISDPGTSTVESSTEQASNTFITPDCGCEDSNTKYVSVNIPSVHYHPLPIKQHCCTTHPHSYHKSYCPDVAHGARRYDTTRCHSSYKDGCCGTKNHAHQHKHIAAVNTIRKQDAGYKKFIESHVLKVKNGFNMPAFGSKVAVAVESTSVANGTIVYNENVGWLEVNDYRKSDSTATLRNFLSDGQVLNPGEPVNPCTEFVFGIPQYQGSTSNANNGQLCLESDFFAMEETTNGSNAVRVRVSSTTGMNSGTRLSIDGYEYVVLNVINATTIDIYNDGSGHPVGTEIEGGLCDGSCANFITILGDENPCNKTPVEEATAVIVCNEGVETTLTLEEGEVVGKENGKVTGVKTPIDNTPRTTFDGCIVLNPALDPQEYLLIVDDATGFVVDDKVYFTCDEESRRFTIQSITGNQFMLTPDFTVTTAEALADDCGNCELVRGDCCERLQAIVDCLKTKILAPIPTGASVVAAKPIPSGELPNSDSFGNDSSQQVYTSISSGGDFYATGVPTKADLPTITVGNPYDCPVLFDFRVLMGITFSTISPNGTWGYEVNLIDEDNIDTFDFNAGNFPQIVSLGSGNVNVVRGINQADTTYGGTRNIETFGQLVIPANTTKVYYYFGRILIDTPGDTAAIVENMPVGITGVLYPQCNGSNC